MNWLALDTLVPCRLLHGPSPLACTSACHLLWKVGSWQLEKDLENKSSWKQDVQYPVSSQEKGDGGSNTAREEVCEKSEAETDSPATSSEPPGWAGNYTLWEGAPRGQGQGCSLLALGILACRQGSARVRSLSYSMMCRYLACQGRSAAGREGAEVSSHTCAAAPPTAPQPSRPQKTTAASFPR